jgi:hypothetical protein
MGLMHNLSRLIGPLFSFIRLPEPCASTFVVSLGSTVAANSMAAQRRWMFGKTGSGTLCRHEQHPSLYQGDIHLSDTNALGLVVGGFYAMVFILTALVKISMVVILSRLYLKKQTCHVQDKMPPGKISLSTAVEKSFKRNGRLFLKIATIHLTMTTLVFVLKDQGAFEVFSILPLAELFGIPSQSIVPLTTYVASPIIGISLLGPMIHSGAITSIQAMIVLMLGSMFMLPFFAIMSLLPDTSPFLGPRLGSGIVAFYTGMSVIVRFVLLLILLSST